MANGEPDITIDHEADAASVALSGRPMARAEEVGNNILIDYDADGRPAGVEVLSLKRRLGASDPLSYLRGLVEGLLVLERQAAE